MKTHLLALTLLCTACKVAVTDANESAPAPQDNAAQTTAQTAGDDPYAFTIGPEPAGASVRAEAIL